MKKLIKRYLIGILLFMSIAAFGQGHRGDPGPPPQNDDPTAGGTPMGGPAPVGGGITLLIGMGLAYGGKKYYDYRKKLRNELED